MVLEETSGPLMMREERNSDLECCRVSRRIGGDLRLSCIALMLSLR